MNKKGASYVSLLITLVIFLSVLVVFGNFSVYISNHKQNVKEANYVYQEITNHISDLYNNHEWELLDDEIISTEQGDLKVLYTYEENTEFATSELSVDFIFKDINETYKLERSVYYE